MTLQGARQIVSLHLPGDFLDLQNLFLNISDHNVQALTDVTTIGIARGRSAATDPRPAECRAGLVDRRAGRRLDLPRVV
jgi:CRP-like cAMP-binding protein